VIAPLASPDAVAEAFRAEERIRHADWRRHVRYCLRCAFGEECRTANGLADAADDAGKKVALAEARLP
jgi:hypothetical protein